MRKYFRFVMRRGIGRIVGYPIDLYANKKDGTISAYYFDGTRNMGDLLTPYIINRLFGLKVILTRSGWTPHLLGIGSILHEANKHSIIWGSGLLGEEYIPKEVKGKNIYALRGKLSKELLSTRTASIKQEVPLGDPGVLMPICLKKPMASVTFRLGIIPHYYDMDIIKSHQDHLGEEVTIINVKNDPETFVKELCGCEQVISSSLHGLILADAYGIKNKWVEFGDRVLGGGFKFRDYYSTTSMQGEAPIVIDLERDDSFSEDVRRAYEVSSVKTFLGDKEQLIEAFPWKNS